MIANDIEEAYKYLTSHLQTKMIFCMMGKGPWEHMAELTGSKYAEIECHHLEHFCMGFLECNFFWVLESLQTQQSTTIKFWNYIFMLIIWFYSHQFPISSKIGSTRNILFKFMEKSVALPILFLIFLTKCYIGQPDHSVEAFSGPTHSLLLTTTCSLTNKLLHPLCSNL